MRQASETEAGARRGTLSDTEDGESRKECGHDRATTDPRKSEASFVSAADIEVCGGCGSGRKGR